MKVLGIDPGLSGGAFLYDTNLEEYITLRFSGTDSKLDITALAYMLQHHKPEVVCLEQIFLAGREGGRSAMTIGSNYGRITAVLDLMGIAYTETTPRVWQRTLGLESGSRQIVKQSAQDLAVKRFGITAFLQGRERKPHDGLTDAACMTLYAIVKQSENLWTEKVSKKSTSKRASSTGTRAKSSSTSSSKSTKPKKSTTKSYRPSKKPKKSLKQSA